MSEYYAINQNENCLRHYGIKGMRWGVRKAIESGNQQKLNRQFQKAQKKLYKLNMRADADFQKQVAKKHGKRAGVALGVGLSGVGGILAANHANKLATAVVDTNGPNLPRQRKKKVVSGTMHVGKTGNGLGTGAVGVYGAAQQAAKEQGFDFIHPVLNQQSHNVHMAEIAKANTPTSKSKVLRDLSTIVAAGGLGTAAYQTGKAIAAKRRSTAKGHAKAVAKRDEWIREMSRTFAGTKYGSKRKVNRK